MFSTLVHHPLSAVRRSWRHRLAGAVTAALALGLAGSALARPPFADPDDRSRRQIEDTQRSDIRRSLGRPDDSRPDTYRDSRRMSDAERQSLRDAVRNAYGGDPRDRQRR